LPVVLAVLLVLELLLLLLLQPATATASSAMAATLSSLGMGSVRTKPPLRRIQVSARQTGCVPRPIRLDCLVSEVV
jgi:uncharacterized protein YggE